MERPADPPLDLRRFDLNLLVVLDALLTEQHVTRAGQRLRLTQSATSAALRRLRRVFGDPLLEPHGRELRLTPLGRGLAQPVREVLRDIDRLIGEPADPDAGPRDRTFVIQTSEYVSAVLLRRLLEIISECGPGLRLRIEAMDETYEDRLHRNDIDLLIAPMHPVIAHRVQRFPHEALFSDDLVVGVWRDHPTVGDSLTVDDLSRLPHLQHAVRGADRSGSMLSLELAAHDVVHTVQATTPSYTLLPLLLRGTGMMAFLPRRLAETMGDAAHLRVLPSPVALPPLLETMYWHPDRDHGDPAHVWLRRQIRALAAVLAEDRRA
jgi:LysR family transcriptional regulator, nod-box dependent transcriptional activator